MKKIVLLIMSLLCAFSAIAGGEVQNGGGGWASDGQYMTFYSAKIPAEKRALDRYQIPGMDYLIQRISALEISERNRAKLLEAIYPIRERVYYSVSAKKFTPEIKEDLLKKYAQLMGISESNVALFAITDGKSGETFLLPEFYQLTTVEQAAILFHESLWIFRNELTYEQVIAAEQDVQAFFEDESSPENVYRFYSQLSFLLDDSNVGFMATLRFDLSKNALSPFLHSQQLDIRKLLGPNFVNCLISVAWPESNEARIEKCMRKSLTYLISLETSYPSSIFIKFLIFYFSAKSNHVSFASVSKDWTSAQEDQLMSVVPTEEIFGLKFPVSDEKQEIIGHMNFSKF